MPRMQRGLCLVLGLFARVARTCASASLRGLAGPARGGSGPRGLDLDGATRYSSLEALRDTLNRR
jgi:hypothetical protein